MRALLLGVLLLFLTGCTKAELLDFAMHSAPHAPSGPKRVGDYELLAGDLHTHVLPPDAPWHVTRGLPSTARLAKAEGLDFVVLTPHVSSRFYMLPLERDWVLRTQAELRAGVDALPEKDVLFVPGMEYTDYRYGHVGLGFANVAEVLNEVTTADPPERFFQRWTAHGGLMVINHPVLRGIPRAPFLELRYDLGWRALFDPPPPVPPEVAWITEHATGIETLNTSISHLRDQFIIGDAERTLREGAHLADRVARTQHRRLTPVGGSDSHGEWMRATTWVLARDRTIAGAFARPSFAAAPACAVRPRARSLHASWASALRTSAAPSRVAPRGRSRSLPTGRAPAITSTARSSPKADAPPSACPAPASSCEPSSTRVGQRRSTSTAPGLTRRRRSAPRRRRSAGSAVCGADGAERLSGRRSQHDVASMMPSVPFIVSGLPRSW
jgi:hypothetical protein